MNSLNIVILGLSLRSSWGNGHATTYAALTRALLERKHQVLFLERDVPWYAENRDGEDDLSGHIQLYRSIDELRERYADAVAQADLVIVGSYVPDGIRIGEWVQSVARGCTAFYDIDTPITVAQLASESCDYLNSKLTANYRLYLSFTSGPLLHLLRGRYGANAFPLYCSVDPKRYAPDALPPRFDLGYMGTYSSDRQPALERLLLDSAHAWPEGRFVVAGAQYPSEVEWPANVARIEHLGPTRHRRFYNEQRFTLNITRSYMIAAGWSPSVRLFEAAACATPIVSDAWAGLDSLFAPGKEILIAENSAQVLGWLKDLPESRRRAIGEAARRRVLAEHTADHRAEALERYIDRVAQRHPVRSPRRICHEYTA